MNLQLKAQRQQTAGVTTQHHTLLDRRMSYTACQILELVAGAHWEDTLKETEECCLVVLTGQVDVVAADASYSNLGKRQSVHEQVPTDSLYMPADTSFRVQAVSRAKIALCRAPYNVARYGTAKPVRLLPAAQVGVERRGTGHNVRQVFNILPDDAPFAHSLLVVEVITASGNSSSYPPHKHDQDNLPHESFLEEIYYHEIHPPQGFVFQRVYTDDRSLDQTLSVENQDLVLVPKGYHPVTVPAGYSSYYLNVMAGPVRKWQFHNDPAHAWILDTPPVTEVSP